MSKKKKPRKKHKKKDIYLQGHKGEEKATRCRHLLQPKAELVSLSANCRLTLPWRRWVSAEWSDIWAYLYWIWTPSSVSESSRTLEGVSCRVKMRNGLSDFWGDEKWVSWEGRSGYCRAKLERRPWRSSSSLAFFLWLSWLGSQTPVTRGFDFRR